MSLRFCLQLRVSDSTCKRAAWAKGDQVMTATMITRIATPVLVQLVANEFPTLYTPQTLNESNGK